MSRRSPSALVVLATLLTTGLASTALGAPDVPSRTQAYANWPTYHGNNLRTGYAPTMPAVMDRTPTVSTRQLDGAVYASPVVVGGRVIVATENDTVYAIQGGKLVWKRHLGSPATQDELPCGNISPLGITGTPVVQKGIVFVAAERSGTPTHRLYALRLADGTVAWKRSLDLPGVDEKAMQQRGALLVAGGRVWVPFGGLAGDCGDYKGRLVGVPVSGSGGSIAFTVPTAREGGIWAPPGPAFDRRNLFVAVGNGAATSGAYDDSDSVLKISTTAHLRQRFAPTNWASDNAEDLDLGSQGPALVGDWVFADGKRGTAYVLHRNRLGGIGGQVSKRSLCASFGGTAVVGTHVFVPCTDGIRAVRIDSAGQTHVLWHAASNITGSPVVGGGRVWSLDPDGGQLYGLDPATGAVHETIGVGATSRFATPAIYGRLLLVPTLAGLTTVRTA